MKLFLYCYYHHNHHHYHHYYYLLLLAIYGLTNLLACLHKPDSSSAYQSIEPASLYNYLLLLAYFLLTYLITYLLVYPLTETASAYQST